MAHYRMTKGPEVILTPEEKLVYGKLFNIADVEKKGVIGGEHAVKFFAKSGLHSTILSEIWQMADYENQGILTQQSFIYVEGLENSESSKIIITQEEREKYKRMFNSLNPTNGLLEGETARGILQRSKLPFETLGKIWSLADSKQRGKLDVTEFTIAMFFVQKSMNGTIKTIPTNLPPGFYEMAAGTTVTTGATEEFVSPASPPFPPFTPRNIANVTDSRMSPIVRQASLSVSGSVSPNFSDDSWDVTPEDKVPYDRFFDTLDKSKKGFLTGDEAASFFMKSNLVPTALAQIWDLSDVNKSGTLSRDEFAVAMYLITKKLTGAKLPSVLPPKVDSPFTELLKRSATTISKNNFGSNRSRSSSNQLSDPGFDSYFSSVQNSDTDINVKFAIESGEIKNLKHQADSLENTTIGIKNDHSTIDANFASLAAQKSELSVRISQLRTLHDTELKSLQEVQAKYRLEHESVERVREELAQIERSLIMLQQEKEQIKLNIQKDREETLDIKKKMRIAEEENLAIKAEIEKIKKESKQQKGMLVINKKQLAAVEGQRSSMSSIGGAGVKRTMSNASTASNSTQGTSSIKSAPINSSKIEEIGIDKPNSMPLEFDSVFISDIKKETNNNKTSRGINPFENSFTSTNNKETSNISQNEIVTQQQQQSTEKAIDPFASFGNSTKQTSGKAEFDSAFSLEEIEASVQGGIKLGFESDFNTSFSNNNEKKSENITNIKDITKTTEEEVMNTNSVIIESNDKIPDLVSTVKELSLEDMNIENMKDNIETENVFSELTQKSEQEKIEQDDEFEAAFGDLSEAKVIKTTPIDFDADFDKFKAFDDFDPFPTSNISTTSTIKSNLDEAFGGISSNELTKSTNNSGFEDAFSEFFTPPQLPKRTRTPQPSSDNTDLHPIQYLQSMGFSKEQSADALERYDYNLEKATNFLVENA
ncbi:11385_t:CDS:10 [Diversispora eburnea]|uniref:11385_t:CDS:1 n=1 Tax=Diversispora eburnea TaxID=1213867 RepID=A0A9N9AHP9_9GLOM|nr:11385_t:CDS:10 [Diversispora eburnea]